MILDALLQFDGAPGQNLTGVGIGTAVSSNIIDLSNLGLPTTNTSTPQILGVGQVRDMGIGDDPALKLLVFVSTAFTTAAAGTLQIALQGAIDVTATGLPAAFSTWWTGPVYAAASLVLGARLYDMDMPRPPAGIAIPRFLRMAYIIGTGVFTACAIQSMIVIDRFDQPHQGTVNTISGGYPAGIVIAN